MKHPKPRSLHGPRHVGQTPDWYHVRQMRGFYPRVVLCNESLLFSANCNVCFPTVNIYICVFRLPFVEGGGLTTCNYLTTPEV